MRILWYSNAPWAPTGYGTQTAQVVRRLKAAGHEIAIANNYGVQAGDVTWEGIPILTAGFDGHSRDVLPLHADYFTPDWIVTLYDVWVFPREQYRDRRVASWVPVDSDPVPPAVLDWCREHLPIAMSQFGHRALKAKGVDARYAPHAIDLDVYQPRRSDFRAQIGVPEEAFLVTINAANKGLPPRKAWPEMFDAFSQFTARHSDAYLYIHTEAEGIVGGLHLPTVMATYGIPPERVRIAPQPLILTYKFSAQQMAAIYTASDVLLATSMGEGFGLAVIEAQAAGTPVIVTDFTAQPELVGAGWTVGYQRYYHPSQGTFWATPLVPDILDRLEQAYAAKGDETLRARAREFVQQYDADKVFTEHWLPILAEMEEITRPKNLAVKPRKAKKRRVAA